MLISHLFMNNLDQIWDNHSRHTFELTLTSCFTENAIKFYLIYSAYFMYEEITCYNGSYTRSAMKCHSIVKWKSMTSWL